MTTRYKILVTTDRFPEDQLARLRDAGAELFHVPYPADAETMREIASREQVDAILIRQAVVPAAVIEASPKLRAVSKMGTGVSEIAVAAATARGVPVTSTRGRNAEAVAQHTVGLIYALVRRIPQNDATLRRGGWDKAVRSHAQLDGHTLGIVGFGHIGRRVAEIMRPLNMTVLAYSPRVPASEMPAWVTRVDLDTLTAESDIVSLHCELTPETRHMFDAARFARMKRSAYLINTGRGRLVDEDALVAALKDGTILGAALDVFQEEPTRPDNPLLALPNTVLTAHIGALTVETEAAGSKGTVDNLLVMLEGTLSDLRVVVNPEVFETRK
jgi:D-3-phosphoglycerate dehydrogenase / 2-oxoglutarate reductase